MPFWSRNPVSQSEEQSHAALGAVAAAEPSDRQSVSMEQSNTSNSGTNGAVARGAAEGAVKGFGVGFGKRLWSMAEQLLGISDEQ